MKTNDNVCSAGKGMGNRDPHMLPVRAENSKSFPEDKRKCSTFSIIHIKPLT